MGENTAIEWAHHTFNPWIGCTKVGPPCDNCYAEALMDRRYHKVQWGPHGERKKTSEANWKLPLRWNKAAAPYDRKRVFCASLADVFDNQVPVEWRYGLFDLINATRNLDWLLLTKRPQNIAHMLPDTWGPHGWPNVWLGITCGDQDEYCRDFPKLAKIPAVVRFISNEPMLGLLTPCRLAEGMPLPDWIIAGGESGPNARCTDDVPAWARYQRDICRAVGIAFFFKQMVGKAPIPPDLMVREFPR
ncbi:MAG: DUF5131 family protein [Rhizobiales bacterium]|nr:DUF5131 family protein [Hyphomicrobiales bacterium]